MKMKMRMRMRMKEDEDEEEEAGRRKAEERQRRSREEAEKGKKGKKERMILDGTLNVSVNKDFLQTIVDHVPHKGTVISSHTLLMVLILCQPTRLPPISSSPC